MQIRSRRKHYRRRHGSAFAMGPSDSNHPNIRTSHPLAPALECSDVRLVGQEARERVLELRCPVAVPREIGSLSRMNDDGTNIIVSQQRRRDLVFGDWASASVQLVNDARRIAFYME